MITKLFKIFLLTTFANLSLQAGTPAEAEKILQEHKLAMKAWQNAMATAKTPAMVKLAMAKKPKQASYKSRMISVVGSELKNPWSLKYAGWLLANTELGKKDISFIMDYAKKFHKKTPDLGHFCYNVALSAQPAMQKKIFITKAHKLIKDKSQKGIAAISLALVLSESGDSAINNANRLKLIKEAIIHSSNVMLGKTQISTIAMDMVYRLKNLTKGRQAIVFSGVNSAGDPISLTQFKDKIVMLIFWSSSDLSTDETLSLLSMMKKFETMYIGKKFALIGVNKDRLENLRKLEKESLTSNRNISDPQQKIFKQYRIANPPHCYVIDGSGIIQYSGNAGSFATLTVDALLNPESKRPQ